MRTLSRLLSSAKQTGAKKQSIVIPSEIKALNAFSMAGPRVLEKQYILGLDVVRREIPGDFVECGTYNGGSAGAVVRALRNTGRRAWLYNSFEGMPETNEIDGADAAQYIGKCVGAVEKVKEAMRLAGFPADQVTIREGWFDKTFLEPLPETVSFLHVDCDWYDSVMLTLNTFYDKVSDGGIILLDDFAHWEGCREAFYDFIAERKLRPVLERFGHTQMYWVKGRLHNREFAGQWEIP